jgi:hypothetical protein
MNTKNLTAEQLAETLNGNEYGNEIAKEQAQLAKENGLVVVFGYSDDNIEFRGAIDDEIGCYDGGEIFFTKEGKQIDEDDMEVLEKHNAVPPLNKIEAIFGTTYDRGEGDEPCSWKYETEIPHSTFRIMEDGELYCVGIIFNISDLK